MTIYISTGGYSKFSADKISKKFIQSGINYIELSAGLYSTDLIDNLYKLKNKANFQIHNYFPPPKTPFVLNLASQNDEIANVSMKHIDHALDCCLKLGAKYYSFHAGFLCDFKVSELGKKTEKRKLYNRQKSIELFLDRVLLISKKAEDKGIQIMIENNVLSDHAKKEFKENHLLMCDAEECLKIINNCPKNVKLLIDVAHLKVSAKSLGFDPVIMLNKCSAFIGGYHLSDNDGLSDTNNSFLEDAWFFKYLKPDLDYYSIEVYGQPIDKMKELVKMLNSRLIEKSFKNK